MSTEWSNMEGSIAGLGYGGSIGDLSSSVDNLMSQHQKLCHLNPAEPTINLQQMETQFVSSKIQDQDNPEAPIEGSDQTIGDDALHQAKLIFSNISAEIDEEQFNQKKNEAVELAKAVLAKFNQPAEHSNGPPKTVVGKLHFECTLHDNLTPSQYKTKRHHHFIRERERLHAAMIKNFEYIAKREEERLQNQFQKIQQARQLQNDLQRQQAFQLQQRKANLLKQQQQQSRAGVGTVKRQKLETIRKRKGNAALDSTQTTAVYLEGLPTIISEDVVRQLFESYGKIRKVHFYRHKETGELKGDGLVVYQLGPKTMPSDLLESVCSQMNGCELPCGSIIKVQPAKSEKDKSVSVVATREDSLISQKEAEVPKDDGLDDFFASL